MSRSSLMIVVALVMTCAAVSCGKEEKPAIPPAIDRPAAPAHHDGKDLELGSTAIGPYRVRAARDEGKLTAGGEAPIDAWVDGAPAPKVSAVRFWIGTADGRGSIKARAQIESPAEPSHWHTHVELPAPLPAGSRLWVEIEGSDGSKSTGSFDLKG